MSFSMDIKTALCKIDVENDCCVKAELYGLLLFARRFSANRIELNAKNRDVALRAQALCARAVGVTPAFSDTDQNGGVLRITKKKDVTRVLEFFGHSADEISYALNYANLENDCCMQSFLRGAFLTCGRVSDPDRGYHLEFTAGRVRAAKSLEAFLKNAGHAPLSSVRMNSYVLYYKDSETIEDILTQMGAVGAALEVMEAKVVKSVRNRENRLTNCEAANIGKTVHAAQEQIKAIEKLKKNGGYSSLPDDLREIARLRVLNPDASLSEIGRMCEPPVSRSGVNHRLSRIIKLSEES